MGRSIAFAVEGRVHDDSWVPLFDTTLLDEAWWEARWAHDVEGQRAAEALVDGLIGRRDLLLEALTGYTRPRGVFEAHQPTRLRSLLDTEGGTDWGILQQGTPTPTWPHGTSAVVRATQHGNAAGWWLWSDVHLWRERCARLLVPHSLGKRLWCLLAGDAEGERRAQAAAVLEFTQRLDRLIGCVVGEGARPWAGGVLAALPHEDTGLDVHPFGNTAHARLAAQATFHAHQPWSKDGVRILLRAE